MITRGGLRPERPQTSSPTTGSGSVPALCSASRQPPSGGLLEDRPRAVGQPAEDVPVLHREPDQGADRRARRTTVGHDDEDLARGALDERPSDDLRGPRTHLRAALARCRRLGRSDPCRQAVKLRRVARPHLRAGEPLPGAAVGLAQARLVRRRQPGEAQQRLRGRPGPGEVGADDGRPAAARRAAGRRAAPAPRPSGRARRRADPGSGPPRSTRSGRGATAPPDAARGPRRSRLEGGFLDDRRDRVVRGGQERRLDGSAARTSPTRAAGSWGSPSRAARGSSRRAPRCAGRGRRSR